MGGSNNLQVMHAVIGENESGTVASQMAKKRQSTLHTLRQRRSLGGGACKGIDTKLVRVIPQFHNAPKGPLGANGQGQTLQQTLLASKTHAQSDAPYGGGGGARRRRRVLLRDAMSASAPMGRVVRRLQRTFGRRPRKARRTRGRGRSRGRTRGRGRGRRTRGRGRRTRRHRTRTGRRRRRR